MKILVLGTNGQLGHCLTDNLNSTEFTLFYSSREKIDITNLEAANKTIIEINPDVIINASAYTAVDKAENEKQVADLVNHIAVANIANLCKRIDCWLIHISTDYVFDGNNSRPYHENDMTNPKSIYGESKLNGEISIQGSGCKYLIIRTAWVFSEYGNNFMKTMLRLGANQEEISIVGDQFGCPTYAQDIAKAIVCMLNYLEDENIIGIYHYSGVEQCSWYQFGYEIFKEAEKYGFSMPKLHSILTSEYPTPAYRPRYSVLDCRKSLKVFGIQPSDWKNGISKALKKLQLN